MARMRATAATEGLARYDMNINGPLGNDWRFNAGGFYRYDHGVRDPGFPGIQGGQLKASITRLLDQGSIRFSVKHINDRNQFILPLPFTNPEDPDYVPGFTDYGSMNTQEGLNLRLETPRRRSDPGAGQRPPNPRYLVYRGRLAGYLGRLAPAEHRAGHAQRSAVECDTALQPGFSDGLRHAPDRLRRAGLCAGKHGADLLHQPLRRGGKPAALQHRERTGSSIGRVARGEAAHRGAEPALAEAVVSASTRCRSAAYLANYSQDNRWFFTDILTDVRDNPRFLDVVVTPAGGGAPVNVTNNGFRRYISNYVNGNGNTTVVSGVVGGEVQLTERLRADMGVRAEYNTYVQNSENSTPVDLDGDPATTYDIESWGNGSFRHFNHNITDWSASLGLNYRINDKFSVYGSGARGYKMPALDELLNATAQAQVDLFDSREVLAGEVGMKYASGGVGITLNGFYTNLKNIIGQGAILDPVTGETTWRVTVDPENRSYGLEAEAVVSPFNGLQLLGSGTVLDAALGAGAPDTMNNGAPLTSKILAIVPTVIGNLAALYSPRSAAGLQFKADWHFVGSRYTERPQERFAGTKLPSYSYFNFGAGFAIPAAGIRVNLDVLNALQGKGLEEGNPRLISTGGSANFLARPILPRRVQASIDYDFGGGR